MKVLEVKLKEKDQELKLAELKVKELRKQIPNTKLKPMVHKKTNRNVHGSLDSRSIDNDAYQEAYITSGRHQDAMIGGRKIKDRKYTQ